MKPEDLIKSQWQDQALELPCVDADAMRERAAAYQRKVSWRNRREFIAGAVVIPVYAWYVWLFPLWVTKLGAALCVLGVIVVLWQLQRRASTQDPASAIGMSSLAFHRAALLRQQKALRDVWLWYIGPLVPGMAVFLYGRYLELGDGPGSQRYPLIVVSAVLIFIAVILINLRAARRLGREIQALDELAGPPQG